MTIQRLVSATAAHIPTWVDTPYKTLAEARRDNPGEYPSFFRRKLETQPNDEDRMLWAQYREQDHPND